MQEEEICVAAVEGQGGRCAGTKAQNATHSGRVEHTGGKKKEKEEKACRKEEAGVKLGTCGWRGGGGRLE